MNVLSLVEQRGLAPRQVSSAKGGEYASACPFPDCVSKSATPDRFRIWPEQGEAGKYWCRGCDRNGDAINLLMELDGKNFREAAAIVGKRLDPRPAVRTPRMPAPVAAPVATVRTPNMPPEQWTERAGAIAAKAAETLLADPARLEWLAKRGITAKTAARFGLGWNLEPIIRPYPAWGLPAETWPESGKPKYVRVPAGLVIPWRDGETVLRLRVRQLDAEPKYYVIPGGAKNPQPLMVLPGTWAGQHKAVVLCEAELDAILLAQEVGDLVTVIALGSAQTRPEDELAVHTVQSAAWIGLWLDRDKAGDDYTAKWMQAYADTAEDIRPQGDGKMDPGDTYAAGVSIREHVLTSLPPAWRIGRSATVQREQGGGAEKQGEGSAEGPKMLVAESVREFGQLLKLGPIVCKSSDAGMSVMAVKSEGSGRIVQDGRWEAFHWDLMRKVSDMFWYDEAVFNYIDSHPSAATGVHGKNYWAGLARKQEK
ncbi:MAG: CHC2 zinc finger domain-containing protein [Desulfomicrobium apsheronum]|nr:CHC2 zinc finger domain-containing protein [Desulfomicrobium apsheronum]